MKIVGIDYGHGETSAGCVYSETLIGNEILMQDLQVTKEHTVIPSVICKMPTDEYVINPTANQLAIAVKIGVCFKAPLIGNNQYKEITEENRHFFQAYIQQVYKSIISNENNPLHEDGMGNPDYKVYIACPSGWSNTQIQAYKSFVIDECKVPIVDIVKESRAAYIASRRKVGEGIRSQGGGVLVIDFGSSTVDFTFFNNESKFEPVHEGYPFGASQIENDVLDYMTKSCNEEACKNYSIVINRCGESRARNLILYEIRKAKELYFCQGNQDFFNPSIHLKELFLDRSLTGLYIEPTSENGYSRDIFENEIIKDYKQSLLNMLDDFVNKEGVTSIDKVILTGGASRMDFFKQMVSEQYHVSKREHSLIVDLTPSLTISEGIAAFGFMNEKSKIVEEPLKHETENWIKDRLPSLLKSTIEKCIGDMYYNEFTTITWRYETGKIVKNEKCNLDGLEDEFLSLLNRWTTNGDEMSHEIVMAVQNSIMNTIGQKLAEFANNWGYEGAVANDFDIPVNLGICASLTPESCKELMKYIWLCVKAFITQRDFWGWDDNTSPFKERDKDDRSSIRVELNSKLRSYFNGLNYISPLDDEVSTVALSINEKLQNYIDSVKLQQYT